MRLLEFHPSAFEIFKKIKEHNSLFHSLLKDLIQEMLQNPESGIGEPTLLKGEFNGLWQRNVTPKSTILYAFDDDTLLVAAILYNEDLSLHLHDVSIGEFSSEDYASVMALMSSNRGKADEPQVGIFWYNRARNELFGVVSHRLSDYTKANASDGRITCSEMHEDVWKKEFRKQKYHGDGSGPYIGAYQDKPRGRVFYNITSDRFEVAVGKWLEEYPQAYELILEEFNLPRDKTDAKYAIHWDIGMSWR